MGKTGQSKTGESPTGDQVDVGPSVTMTGSATLTATDRETGSASLAGSATLTATGTVSYTGEASLAGSATLSAVVDVPPPVPSTGWHVVVTHPDTGRPLVADVLDEPERLLSLNRLPEVRVPVRKSAAWLDPALEDDPPMDVYLDGEKQPIDELRAIDDRTDRTVLRGVGGVELEQRVRAEYRSEQRHVAAEGLIDSETTYQSDVDTPTLETIDDRDLQSASTTTEFERLTDYPDTYPIDFSGDTAELLQCCWFAEGEDSNTDGTLATLAGDFSNNTGGNNAVRLTLQGDVAFFDFTPEYTIPNGDVAVGIFCQLFDFTGEVTYYLNGTALNSPTFTNEDTNNTLNFFRGGAGIDQALDGGTSHEFRVEITDKTGGLNDSGSVDVDFMFVFDEGDRFGGTNINTTPTYDDPTESYNGPELYPESVEIEANDHLSAFNIDAVDATIDIDDTTNNQRLQVSPDRGQTYLPNDGTEDNTDSISVNFTNETSTVRLRTDLSRYEPNGQRSITPNVGYDGQVLSSWDIDGDLTLQSLLIDQAFDDSLDAILTEIASEDYLWSVSLDDSGDYQVGWTQPGARTSESDPAIGDVTVTKDIDVYEKVTIKGRSKQISSEEWTATTSFDQLDEAGTIVVGSETVYDSDGVNYSRGSDYEVNYQDGDLSALSGGDLSVGDTYLVDYDVETVGSYTVEGAGANPREFVESVPAVASEASAESIAYVLASKYSVPRYAADVTLPRTDTGFDPLDALPLAELDLPDDATPLEVREQPEVTPSGVQLRLGSRGRLQQALSSISQQLQAVSKGL